MVEKLIRSRAIDECAMVISSLADNVQELKLCMGEMTAQEMRTLRSGLRLAAHKVRLLKHKEPITQPDG
jgi:hypothetical protein